MTGVLLNVGCGPHRAPAPWVNVDTVRIPGVIDPDVVARHPYEYGLSPGDVDRVYCGHVLEHLPWDEVRGFLMSLRTLLSDEGTICVVGPDVHAAAHLWRDGSLDWATYRGALEDDESHQAEGDVRGWVDSRHLWNCYSARLVRLLVSAGYEAPTPTPLTDLDGWPVVSHAPWQCAVIAAARQED